MFKNKEYFYLILWVIVIISVGFVFYKIGFNKAYQTAKQEIELRYQSKIQELFPEPEEMLSFMARITDIKRDTLSIVIPAATFNPFAEDMIKKVKITDSTEIVKRIARPEMEFQKEQEAYNKILESFEGSPEDLPPSPLPFEDVKIEITELKIGDEITVEAEENIKDKDEFTAKKIILQFAP